MTLLRLTDRRLWLVSGLALILALWLGGRLPWMMVQLIIVTFALDLAWLLTHLHSYTARLELAARRLHAGRPVPFTLRIDRRRRLFSAGTSELLPDGFLFSSPLGLQMGSKPTWQYHGYLYSSRRGRQIIGPVRLRTHSPFGLWVLDQFLLPRREVLFYPEVTPPKHMPKSPGASRSASIRRPQPILFTPEHFDTRPYVPGDPPQRIHWKLSAHLGQLYVRQELETQQGRLLLLLDCSPLNEPPDKADRRFEQAISFTAHLASTVIQQKIPFLLASWGGIRPPLAVGRSSSRSAYDDVMTWLSLLPVHRELHPFHDLEAAEALFQSLRSEPSHTSRMIFITPRIRGDRTVQRWLRLLSGRMAVDVHKIDMPGEVAP